MTTRLSIGDFSRMTYLSVKALRRYHDLGLLVPATVDEFSGYRYYEPGQVPTGQVIRRFRDLGMPLEQLKELLAAPDTGSRNELIVAHLRRMEQALEQTQQTVASLRSLLEQPSRTPAPVAYRSVPATTALAISESVAMADIETWWSEAFEELHQVLAVTEATRTGPDGTLYPEEFFENERGLVVAFIPAAGGLAARGRIRPLHLPAAELAVLEHRGAFAELDQAYGELGVFVAEREIGVQGPIREHYVITYSDTDDEAQHLTEVCWPVFGQEGNTMASIVKETVIEAAPEVCWSALRDFGQLDKMARGFITESRMAEPREREITFFTGTVVREYLVGIDEERRRLAYTVTSGPLGSTHYNASAQIFPEGDSRCRFTWIVDILPDSLSEIAGGLMDRGLAAIKTTMEDL